MSRESSAERAARAVLGVGPEDGPAEIEAAFRRRVGPLSRAATVDAAASERLRGLIEARKRLRAAAAGPVGRAAEAVAPPPRAGAPLRLAPLGFRLAENGRDVEVTLALDALVAAAAEGAVAATLDAPVLRRCASCVGAGRSACPYCHGAGVVETPRRRLVALDLERLAQDDFTIEASPWSDAHGRGARGGPLLRARLV